jgi:hypothetical protein
VEALIAEVHYSKVAYPTVQYCTVRRIQYSVRGRLGLGLGLGLG